MAANKNGLLNPRGILARPSIMIKRWISGLVILCAMVAIAVAILVLVTISDPDHASKCVTEFSVRWLGCAMAVHETLAAGLLAAIGALFGAWLAFNAVQDQIDMAKRNEREAERLKAERESRKHIGTLIS
jgi:lysylphosphatidylglycerol synthetase-like protein (DUF2156 family)